MYLAKVYVCKLLTSTVHVTPHLEAEHNNSKGMGQGEGQCGERERERERESGV